ncbi:MAG TPA: DUF4870 domain-containing protein, partial [Candidatus Baltobacteraceae bacterium]|nr:DUF4870 domain-containing protein [Candidatus Baltobacteraceae bacterium]
LAAVFTHLGGMLFLFVPALIVWLRTRKDPTNSWLVHEAKEALNFQYTVTAALCICLMLNWTGSAIGLRLFQVVLAFDWVFSIVAAVKAARGERFAYPLNVRFVR